ncbi:hypothetical protein U9M48_037032 [Paspalum notatum var. saurae]|uniref:Protein kinase domain-containing protein n=1 Tax=Paspalum notatum var. saurae TaxID=547442 RepID=A0AAQ3XAN1_PASNO
MPQNSNSTTGIRGNIGYVAPEYGGGSSVSTQGDVYSFCILLLEMFTRRKPTDERCSVIHWTCTTFQMMLFQIEYGRYRDS